MQKIEQLLSDVGLKMYECNAEWRERVEKYKALFEAGKIQSDEENERIQETLVRAFFDFHDVEVEDLEEKKEVKNAPIVDIDYGAYNDDEFMAKVRRQVKKRQIRLSIG